MRGTSPVRIRGPMIKSQPLGNSGQGDEPSPSSAAPMSELAIPGAAMAQVLPDGRTRLDSEIKSTVRATDREARLRWMVDEYIDFVARVLRNAGTPAAEIDDDVQRTFIAAARRLDDVRPGAERSFLLQTALYVAAHARRTVARRREVAAEEAIELLIRHSQPSAVVEIIEIQVERAVGLDVDQVFEDPVLVSGHAVRCKPHDLVFPRVDLEPGVIGEG